MSKTISLNQAFGIVAISVLFSLSIGLFLSALDFSFLGEKTPRLSTYISIFLGQALLVVPIIIFLKNRRLTLSKAFRINRVSKKIIFSTILLSFGAMLLSNEISILLEKIIPIPDSFLKLEEVFNPESSISLFLLFLTVVIIAPFGEELVFRGFLQQYLESFWGDITKAILVSSLFFAVIHFNPFWFIQIYFLGVLLGYLCWKTKSVVPSIIFHVIINGSSMLFSILGSDAEKIIMWNSHINPLLLIFGIVFLITGIKQLQSGGI